MHFLPCFSANHTVIIEYMSERELYSSGVPWEPLIGYSRAIRVGSVIYISGTTATDASGEVLGIGDPYQQTKKIIENIKKALDHFGVGLDKIVRTRIFITDMSKWTEVGRAHQEAFSQIRPVNTIVQVNKLVDPRMLVEIEAEAVI